MIRNLFCFCFLLIITTANLYAKDYDCVNTDFDPKKTEYYNVITDLEKNKVIYLWKFPLSPHQRVKANKITEVKNDIIFFDEIEAYYRDTKMIKTGRVLHKKIISSSGGRATIYTHSKFDIGNNVEWVTHRCREIK
jgi:hypothetical protein|tara:strand:+ start:1331 stop:1738 length:408 start_codon:yes stop_codon:yes gene_type:complete